MNEFELALQMKVEPPVGFTPGEDVRNHSYKQLQSGRGRDLRDVIPSGKGRFSKGEKGVQEYLDRIRYGQKSGMRTALPLMNSEHSGDIRKPSVLCIAAGGPGLAANADELRHQVKRGAKVIAVNKSPDWCHKHGIPVHYGTLLDPKDWVAGYIDLRLKESKEIRAKAGKHWAETKYLIASQCHPNTLAKFKGRKDSYLYHAAAGLGEKDVLRSEFPGEEWAMLSGGSVIGLRAILIGHFLGFREFHTFGLDGSAKMPTDAEMKQIFAILLENKLLEWKKDEPPTQREILGALFTIIRAKTYLPESANVIIRKYLYSYSKPHIDSTWSAFTIDLKTGWSRSFLANHHMARSVYEFEDSMKEWDALIKQGRMEPFTLRVHGNPEQSAIAMVAAGMGQHFDPIENERYGKAPEALAA